MKKYVRIWISSGFFYLRDATKITVRASHCLSVVLFMLSIQRKEHHVWSTTIQRAEKTPNIVPIMASSPIYLYVYLFVCVRHSSIYTCVVHTSSTNVNYYILVQLLQTKTEKPKFIIISYIGFIKTWKILLKFVYLWKQHKKCYDFE